MPDYEVHERDVGTVRIGFESDGEGWWDCSICGLHAGYKDFQAALHEGIFHDCSWEVHE